MKRIFFAVTALAVCGILSIALPAIAAKTNPLTFITSGDPLQFKTNVIELGNVKQGKPVTVEFSYTNESAQPVIIANVQTSCGCTIASYEKEPIMPGKSGKISATYNAAATGVFTKSITVTFDGQQQKVLTMKGTVVSR